MNLPLIGTHVEGPSEVGELRLEELLGGGAFGFVYRAQAISDGSTFAVKFPQCNIFGDDRTLAAFRNEVKAAQEIRHLNVVPILHVNLGDEQLPPYLVMEFIAGGNLQSHLDAYRSADRLPEPAVVRKWSDELIDGIAAVNAKMLHRDVKPDNIMVDDGVLKLADFGLSKVVGAATRSQTFKGGQHGLYMAPEGWKMETNSIQVDMYSVGIVLFELASLEYPYELPADTANFSALERMHLFQNAKLLGELRSDLPPAFCHIVSRLMAKRKEDRFANWGEVKTAIQKAWGGEERTQDELDRNVAELVETVAQWHDERQRRQTASREYLAEEEEKRRLDAYQETELLKALDEAVSRFNERSVFGQVSKEEPPAARSNSNASAFWSPLGATPPSAMFRLPNADYVLVYFQYLEKPLTFSMGVADLIACITDATAFDSRSDNGFTCFLCRREAQETDGSGENYEDTDLSELLAPDDGNGPSASVNGCDISDNTDIHEVVGTSERREVCAAGPPRDLYGKWITCHVIDEPAPSHQRPFEPLKALDRDTLERKSGLLIACNYVDSHAQLVIGEDIQGAFVALIQRAIQTDRARPALD